MATLNQLTVLLSLFGCLQICQFVGANNFKKHHSKKVSLIKVDCSPSQMQIEVTPPYDSTKVYLEHLKGYPEPACSPKYENGKAIFRLDLQDFFKCMVTRVLDRETGRQVFYQRIVLERPNKPKHQILVQCDSSEYMNQESNTTSVELDIVKGTTVVKRSAQFPANFEEPDYEIEITSEITGKAPVPELLVGVKQEGILIDDELTVKPGTPLSMEINLDSNSKDIYGLMVSSMEVTDTQQQEEVLILNGCTVDPYLFENFLTEDGDLLRAKFKAFKFPESNFVLFRGVVNVCLDKCTGVDCANGQTGFGRKRRSPNVSEKSSIKNKIYKVSMSTVVRVGEGQNIESRRENIENVENRPKNIENVESRREKESFVVEEAVVAEVINPDELALAALSEEFGVYKFVDFATGKEGREGKREKRNVASAKTSNVVLISSIIALLHLWA